MNKIMSELAKVEQLLNEYYENEPFNEQKNKFIKNRIKELIILAYEDASLSETDKQASIDKALILLAEHTGCGEDYQIAQAILDDLYDQRKIINQKNIDDFYANSPIGRWL